MTTRACFLMAAAGVWVCLFGLSAAAQDPAPVQIVRHTSSPFYDNIFVVDENGLRSLRFGTATADSQTLIRPGHPEQLPMPYLRSAAVALMVPDTLQRLLMIGLGGGAFVNFVRARLPDVYMDAVEIDPVVAQIAREYFALSQGDKLQVHVVDAVAYVEQSHQPYDLIFLDAYGADELPEALLTRAFLGNVRANLASGGVVVANVAISGTSKAREVIRRIADPFYFCLQLRSPPRYNDVLLLSLDRLPDRDELIARARRFDTVSNADLALHAYAATARPCFEPAMR